MHLAGRPEEAARYLERAARIDPARPDVRENLEALGVPLPADDAESAVLARPEDPEAWDRLVNELWSRGRTNSARAVKAMAELRRRVAA